jgi:hypothetical protein
MWDMTGRSVMTRNLENQSEGDHQLELNLESHPDGMYLLRIKTRGGEKSVKILIKK